MVDDDLRYGFGLLLNGMRIILWKTQIMLILITSMGLMISGSLRANAQTYGPYPEETYITCNPTDTPTHVVILVHGGGWGSGSDSNLNDLRICHVLASDGILVIAIDYRLTTEVPWPAQLIDLQVAVRWARKTYSLPTCTLGTSSAGQMALMSGGSSLVRAPYADPINEAKLYSRTSSRPDCTISISGPTNLRELYREGRLIKAINRMVHGSPLPPVKVMIDASPVAQTELGEMPPTFLMQGRRDTHVPVSQGGCFWRRMKQAREQLNDTYVVTPGGHVFKGLTGDQVDAYIQSMGRFITEIN